MLQKCSARPGEAPPTSATPPSQGRCPAPGSVSGARRVVEWGRAGASEQWEPRLRAVVLLFAAALTR